ncbi:STAS domain-containing protein [Ramlibacter sp. 2FC]|uniref:STAS domain-containing protein n=1 Tax=Ramlibacter sp. 2FC TaxID=2502188 RepID=UPI0010F9AF82|nr:STAS domain-containing protein [Ramlibacter sp. 2FC]
MSKDNGGLLSKVVRFVRHPTVSWSELDHQDTVRDDEQSRQRLKEMIERKKRNDFVRGREFDMLRKIRQRELLGGPDAGVRPSFFQSSLLSTPDGRARTLKKIDEIEAQMSMQWWKSKRGDLGSGSSAFSSSGESSSQGSSSQGSSSQGSASRGFSSQGASAPQPLRTAPAPLLGEPTQRSAFASTARSDLAPLAEPAPPSEGFSVSKSDAIEVGELAHDQELEEASIRFASGDEAGAEAGLLKALGSTGTRGQHLESWLALFDLYRATGWQDRFERAALDFALRFQRSAPQWFSMSERAGQAAPARAQPAGSAHAHWTCPATLGVGSLTALQEVLARTASPWRLDWRKLQALGGDEVLQALRKVLASWAARPVQIGFVGGEMLEQWLAARTPAGDATAAPEAWLARLALLRVMGRMEEFDEVALNYCVTYEVSPPAWEAPACTFLAAGAAAPAEAAAPAQEPIAPSDEEAPALVGGIVGDASAQLAVIEAKSPPGDRLSVDCACLARVDFAAAGTLLNWVVAQQAQGRQVEFLNVHRLVAAFFHVIGISEQARVVLRTD